MPLRPKNTRLLRNRCAETVAKKPSLKLIYTSGDSAEVFRGDFVLPAGVDFRRKTCRTEDLPAT
jgi:hypothetical protein